MILENNILKFYNLSRFDNLVHGFSTSSHGDLRPSHPQFTDSLIKFTEAMGVTKDQLVRMNQMHTNNVAKVSQKDCGQKIENTDGLVTKDQGVFLGVVTGDCLPLLFYDPKTGLVAAVHAGWRGLFSEIIKVTVTKLIEKGSDPKDILVGIGPSIRVCCYEVSEEFVQNFSEKFKDVEKFVVRRDGKIYFDLQKIAKEQLAATGLLETNIEYGDYCTFDHTDVYSYRREGKEFGEMMGIIGIL